MKAFLANDSVYALEQATTGVAMSTSELVIDGMSCFAGRLTVSEALTWVDGVEALGETETVGLPQALGRVLARVVAASADLPDFARAAMDGYALRACDVEGAGAYAPLPLRVVGDSRPGRASGVSVGLGEAVRILTGAPMPDGADAVLPIEQVQPRGDNIEALAPVAEGMHVSPRGEDLAKGEIGLQAGRRLRPQDVGLLSALGSPAVEVRRRPRVRLLITGGEVVPPEEALEQARVHDANGPMLSALIARDGGELESLQRLGDDRAALVAALSAPGADLLLVSGGSSVGDEDYGPGVLRELGELAIRGVAMRPGSPVGMGRIGACPVFLLSGNPVACLLQYDLFAGRALRRLGGLAPGWPYACRRLRLSRKVSSAPGRLDICRVRVDGGQAVPITASGASLLTTVTRADGFVLVPDAMEGYAEGTEVDVFLYDPCAEEPL